MTLCIIKFIIQMKIYLLLQFIIFVISQSQFQLSTDSYYAFQTKINIAEKQVIMNVDLTVKDFQICCKPNRSVFQIVYNFLSNPFFQINEFACPNNPQTFGIDQIKLPTLGLISMEHDLVQYPTCQKGVFGLSKKSSFLHYLPLNFKIFHIIVNTKQGPSFKKYSLKFGHITHNEINFISKQTFSSKHEELWDLSVKQITLGSLSIQENATIMLVTNQKGLKVPISLYSNLGVLFKSNQECISREDEIYCPCESGIPQNFPSIFLKFNNSFTLKIKADKILQEDSQVCRLLIGKSNSSIWQVDVSLFDNTMFKFDTSRHEITITKEQTPNQENASLIQLPIQLILNCFVILLLCVFVALIIIQIIKRVSGLAEVSDESFRQYMIRRNIQ